MAFEILGSRESARSEMSWVLNGDRGDEELGIGFGVRSRALGFHSESDWVKTGLTWGQEQDS